LTARVWPDSSRPQMNSFSSSFLLSTTFYVFGLISAKIELRTWGNSRPQM
jgi:hypothetical protein